MADQPAARQVIAVHIITAAGVDHVLDLVDGRPVIVPPATPGPAAAAPATVTPPVP